MSRKRPCADSVDERQVVARNVDTRFRNYCTKWYTEHTTTCVNFLYPYTYCMQHHQWCLSLGEAVDMIACPVCYPGCKDDDRVMDTEIHPTDLDRYYTEWYTAFSARLETPTVQIRRIEARAWIVYIKCIWELMHELHPSLKLASDKINQYITGLRFRAHTLANGYCPVHKIEADFVPHRNKPYKSCHRCLVED